MNKVIRVIIVVMLLLSVSGISGCSKDKKTKSLEKNKYIKILPSGLTKEDEPVIAYNYSNFELKKNNTAAAYILAYVFTTEPLAEEDISVRGLTEMQYDVIGFETTKVEGKISKELCLQYNKFDWEANDKLLNSNIVEERDRGYQVLGDIDKEYEALTDEMFPTYYANRFSIQPRRNDVTVDQTITQLDFIIKGVTYTRDIGLITVEANPTIWTPEEVGNYDLDFNGPFVLGFNIASRKKGLIDINQFYLIANENATIKNIFLRNNSDKLSIEKVALDTVVEGININQEWKQGDELLIKAGTETNISFLVKDTRFEKNRNYISNINFAIEYEIEGNTYKTSAEAICETRFKPQEYYAIFKDKVDITTYPRK